MVDLQLIFTLASGFVGFGTAVAVFVTSLWNLRAARMSREAAERAELRALESLRASQRNAETLSRVATSSQLNGRLTEFKRIVQAEADARIRAVEREAEKAFVAGVESQRSAAPVATAAALEEFTQLVIDAVAGVTPDKPPEEKSK